MATDISKAIDECVKRINRGESIEQCLADYPQIRTELEPLLKTVAVLTSVPPVSISEEYRQTSQAQLMQRLREESVSKNESVRAPTKDRKPTLNWHRAWQSLVFRPLIPVALTVVLILAISLSFLVFRGSAVAAECTLSILSGSAEVQKPGSSDWQPGVDSMPLLAGSRIRTETNSNAVLTFIDGSTSKLESGTEVSVVTSEYKDAFSVKVVLNQQSGKVWNYIQKTGDRTTDFQIRTPSASIAAQGTSFSTEVDASGITRVNTVDGIVKVSSQEQEVYLAMDQQTQIKPGTAPETPQTVSDKEIRYWSQQAHQPLAPFWIQPVPAPVICQMEYLLTRSLILKAPLILKVSVLN